MTENPTELNFKISSGSATGDCVGVARTGDKVVIGDVTHNGEVRGTLPAIPKASFEVFVGKIKNGNAPRPAKA
ncbi:MAG TPA: hypothetical protein VLF93_07925 [Candidatus Saccharimonadales bacterium]|nr:hypothetical protein [Candidatus Saccharimonadales bacterium]